jgi:uncharacterized repeat protein (TIGR01451 family)
MQSKRILRTPLAVLIGLLAVLVVPSVAQAHHVNSSAKCELRSGVPTIVLTAQFVEFSSTKTVDGTVWIDGSQKFNGRVPVSWNGNNGTWTYTTPGTAGQEHTVKTEWRWNGAPRDGETHKTNTCPTPPRPDIEVTKNGPSTRYVGEQATFTYQVKNTGNVTLANVTVSDDKCPNVTPASVASLGAGQTANFTCTLTITDAMGDELVNVAEACGKYGDTRVCDDDDHKTKIPKPAIALVKDGAATAVAGSTFTYTFKATNIGNVTLTNVVLTDDKCQSTLTRTDPNSADPTFDKGDEWFYTCTVIAPTGPAQVDNLAKVCGDYTPPPPPGGTTPKTVCAEDPHTFTVPPPSTPPTNPPANPPATPPASTPDDTGVLPEQVLSGRAALRGPSGCVKQAFKARVTGRSITAVTFYVDGRRVKRVTSNRSSYSLTVKPGTFGFGRHRIEARVEFTAASGTKARRLPLTFRRCAQGTVAPRFTG